MNRWTDDEVNTLLRDAMTLHEDEVDSDRARQLAFEAAPRRRQWPVVAAASAAAILACGVAVYAGTQGNDNASPTTRGPGPTSAEQTSGYGHQGTTEENRQLAIAASEAVVASMPVPDGSVKLDGKPADWPGGGMALGPSDESLTRTAWWSVPLDRDGLVTFLGANAPAGMERPAGEHIVASGDSDGVGYTDYKQIAPADPDAHTAVSLLVQFKQFGDHTVMRVDTFLAARYGTDDVPRIGGDVTSVEIARVHGAKPDGSGGGPMPTVQLDAPADSAAIDKLVSTFNNLPGSWTHGGFLSCPAILEPAPQDTVTFTIQTADGSTSTMVARYTAGCWGQVDVRVDGRQVRATLDPDGWDEVVQQVANAAG